MADYLIVGGGSCGSVLAARLSALPGAEVTLLEAGPAWLPAEVPAELVDPAALPIGPDSRWVRHFPVALADGISGAVPRGRVLGGSSAVNGCYFVRATPRDFTGWPAGWSFDEVLPAFRRSESDRDFTDDVHGTAGPIPVRREPPERLSVTSAAFTRACLDAGHAYCADHNAPTASGVGPVPLNVEGGRRINVAAAYLAPLAERANLRISGSTRALGIVFHGSRAIGVRAVRGGVEEFIAADHVVLCAGAIESAQLLLCSGVGAPAGLRALGIAVVAPLAGVGTGLADHAEIGVPYRLRAGLDDGSVPVLQSMLNDSTVELRPYTRSFEHLADTVHEPRRMLGLALMAPESRGTLSLATADPAQAPVIAYRHLDAASDRAALRAASEVARDVLERMRAAGVVAEIDPDYAPHDDWLRARLGTSQHMTGTCRMGTADDPLAVVGADCRVHGVDGLSVVDASIAPTPISRGIHATAVMIAERAAELMAKDAGAPPSGGSSSVSGVTTLLS
ncbi:mycofactocin system GMC family oxidoreductase MftG [Aldersonia sp. NBC_00410]|uniref:mycofactocin dehydrogenase MftG n=1 Tax=Aldersonia sp. NBC_00410 TaxID=2975954 RepID=UPI002258A9C5|nr:mycofactocin system GMC family oxidoreductase MftG [Aldersonia sp. NBC_00410]MCX5041592.1 mycofactocin system GMC family oxidoreductase MftG [Aldersonia sp. NBC_00410]